MGDRRRPRNGRRGICVRANPKNASGGMGDRRRPRNERRGVRVRDDPKSEKSGGVSDGRIDVKNKGHWTIRRVGE
jgi:hypothetical protein